MRNYTKFSKFNKQIHVVGAVSGLRAMVEHCYNQV